MGTSTRQIDLEFHWRLADCHWQSASNELRDLLLNRIHWNVVLPGSDCVARVCGQGLIVLLQYYFCAIGLQYCLPVLRRVKFGEPVLLLSANLNEPQ